MRTSILTILSLPLCFALLSACSEDTTGVFPTNFACRANSDCERGQVCSAGVCVRPSLDAGTTPREDASNAPDAGDEGLDATPTQDTAPGEDTTPGADASECTPNCTARQCGSDGCGGSCGTCGGGGECTAAGLCQSGGEAGDSCSEILSCINICTDQACYDACLSAGSPTGRERFVAVFDCVTTRCADAEGEAFAICQREHCSSELSACSGVPEGSATCAQVFDCVLPCPDRECADACYASGTSLAQFYANDLALCAADACESAVTVGDFHACAATTCPSEYNTCYP